VLGLPLSRALPKRGRWRVRDGQPDEIIDSGVCHWAIFEDPDGNMLILHHRYAPPDADA